MESSTRSAKVKNVPVDEIQPNPHNPRRLFDEEPMRILRESIQNLGILVPVTLYESGPVRRGKAGFVLLDGERRWRCARELKLETIPAIVVEKPTDTRNILTMFHIHNLREGWQLMPTALKLQVLMDTLNTQNERELSELTKLSISQIRRCKILLSYPKKFQDLMLAPPTERLKADFFIELDRIRRPAREEHFPPWTKRGDAKCVSIVLGKYENETIKAVTDFRRLAEIYRASVDQNKLRQFMSQLDSFLEKPDKSIDDIKISGATFAKQVKEIRRSAKRLFSQIKGVELEAIASDKETIIALKQLAKVIELKLRDALVIEAREEFGHED